MTQTRKEIVQYYSERIKRESMDFSDIRAELELDNYEKDEIAVIFKRIDRNLIQESKIKSDRLRGRDLLITGLLIMFGGILATVISYARIMEMGGRYIIAYGPILVGFVIASIGKLKMNR